MNYVQEVAPQLGNPPESANRPIPFPGNVTQRMIPRRSSGWDPYEVWRTRVKVPNHPAAQALDLDKAG